MAFRHIPGNSQYQYDQSPPDPGVGHPLRALWQKSENGIRTEHGQSTYVRCHRVGSTEADPNDPHVHGEISKSYWDLRSSVSSYGVLALEPKLILDFKESVFDTNGTASTFDASITHSASSNATMTDSDGLLKWRPHNVMTYSQDFTNSNWATNLDIFANVTTAPDGTLTADKLIEASGEKRGRVQQNVAEAGRTIAVYAKAAEWDHVSIGVTNSSGFWSNATFNLTSGTLAGGAQYGSGTGIANITITSVGDGWYLCTVDITLQSGASPWAAIMPFNQSGDPVNPSPALFGDGTSGIYVWGAHTYRSDLGGMVNNPDTNSSYVPTTTTAVFLSRRGQHAYNDSAWVNEGILHESEARTNLLPYSSVLNSYTRLNTTTSTPTVVSPSGLQDAVLVRPTVATGITWVYLATTINTGAVTTISTFAKTSGKPFVAMANSNGDVIYASFNLTTGAVGTVASGYTANIEDFGNGWYRCSVTTPTGFNERAIYAVSDTDGGIAAGANGNDGILLYGAQLEAGLTPSSYIPTSGSAVTRAAETLTVPTANLPYNSTNMSFQMDGKMTYANSGAVETVGFFRWYLNSGTNIMTRLNTNGIKIGNVYTSGVGYNLPNVYYPGVNVPFNIAARYGSTFTNLATDGTAYTASTYNSASDNLSSTNLNLGDIFMGTIGEFRMWSDDLGDVGITEATLPSTEPSLSLTFDGSENSFIVLDWSE